MPRSRARYLGIPGRSPPATYQTAEKLAIAEQRERERGDRIVGTVRGQHALVHTFRKYDMEVDTSAATPLESAEAILAVLDARSGDG
jgi:Chloramphenicol phosphotransferase-like protein